MSAKAHLDDLIMLAWCLAALASLRAVQWLTVTTQQRDLRHCSTRTVIAVTPSTAGVY
jgi:hypothetical protein